MWVFLKILSWSLGLMVLGHLLHNSGLVILNHFLCHECLWESKESDGLHTLESYSYACTSVGFSKHSCRGFYAFLLSLYEILGAEKIIDPAFGVFKRIL